MPQVWTYHSLRHDHTRTEPLELRWEVNGDPISDSYTPTEMSAHELFDAWARRYGSDNGGLLSIYWSVSPVGQAAPLQAPPFEENAETGEPINWMTLPVFDKRWNLQEGDRGGFIQESTGWKPSALQPYATCESLLRQVVEHHEIWFRIGALMAHQNAEAAAGGLDQPHVMHSMTFPSEAQSAGSPEPVYL